MTPFSERLLKAARYAGVEETQAGIAKALGLTRQTVNHWFTKGEPSSDNLLDIAAKCGVSAEWLQSGEGDMIPAPDNELSAEEKSLVRDYRAAKPQIRDVIRNMARAARKTAVTIAALIPPLMAPQPADAGLGHNVSCAPLDGQNANRITGLVHIVSKWLRRFCDPVNNLATVG